MEENTQPKPTYEQLEALANQLRANNFQMAGRITQLQRQLEAINLNAFNMKYLFKVLKHKECFPEAFVQDCANSIMQFFIVESNTDEGLEDKVETDQAPEE